MVKKEVSDSSDIGCSKCFRRLLFIALFVFVLQIIFTFAPIFHYNVYIHDIIGNVFIVTLASLAFISAIMIYRRLPYNFPREKKAKLFLILAVFFLLLGDFFWLISEVFFGDLVPIGSFPDFAWLTAYVLIVISLIYFISIGFRSYKISAIWVVIVSLIVGGIILGFDVAEDLEEGSFSVAHAIQDVYIIFDIIVLFLVVYLIGPIISAGPRFYLNWLLLGVGILTRAAYDQIFANMSQLGQYYTGHPVDLLYALLYIFIIASFYVKSRYLVVKE